jgi:hypothetical protein
MVLYHSNFFFRTGSEVKVLHVTETPVFILNHWMGVGADSAKA